MAYLGLEDQIAPLKGKAGLLIPMSSLAEHAHDLSETDQAILANAAEALTKHYYFLGEFIFTDPITVKESVSHKDAKTPRALEIIEDIMKDQGFGFGAISHWSFTQDEYLGAKKTTSLTNQAGVTRRDVVQDFFLQHFGSDEFNAPIEIVQPAHTGGKNLTAKFKLQATGNTSLTQEQLEGALNEPLKRAITRAWLQATDNSSLRTNDAHEKFSSKDPVTVLMDDQGIRVTIPLTSTYHGAIEDRHIDLDTLTQSLGREVKFAQHYTH